MSKSDTDNLTRFFDASVKIASVISQIVWEGTKRFNFKDKSSWFSTTTLILLLYFQVKKTNHLVFIDWCFDSKFVHQILVTLWNKVPFWIHYFCSLFPFYFIPSFIYGLKPYGEKKRLQKAIDRLNLKNGMGVLAKLTKVKNLDAYRTELTLYCPGIGGDQFEEKRDALSSSLGKRIEAIIKNYEQKGVKIILTTKRLATHVPLEKVSGRLKYDGEFVIGETESGVKVQSIKELPHILIAGSTGGGKSVFLKQMLVGLLKSTPKLQMYLIDLKGGLELIDFKPLSNVRIVKTEKEAVALLRKIVAEMKTRFEYLEKNRLKSINCDRDKKDRIVVAIDESSVLYTKSNSDDVLSKLVTEARSLTDEIAKLSRAAGIHLILATQKVSKETVDTKVQENIAGKVCFKMNTLQGSVAILGNKDAFELPQIAGRGIWSLGSHQVEIQAPILTDKELDQKILELNDSIDEGSNYQPMIELSNFKNQSMKQFNDFTEESLSEE